MTQEQELEKKILINGIESAVSNLSYALTTLSSSSGMCQTHMRYAKDAIDMSLESVSEYQRYNSKSKKPNIFKTLFSNLYLIVSTLLKVVLSVLIMSIAFLLTIVSAPIVLLSWCYHKIRDKEFDDPIVTWVGIFLFLGLGLTVELVWGERFWGP